MYKTDLLFKKDLIFRDHQLKKIQITQVFKVQSLLKVQDFSKTFHEHLRTFKKKKLAELSSLMSYGMTITILIILLCYIEVISLASQLKNVNKPKDKSGPILIIPTHGFENRVFLLSALTNHYTDPSLQKKRTLYQKSFLTNVRALI